MIHKRLNLLRFKTFTPLAFVYEDELLDLLAVIAIMKAEVISTRLVDGAVMKVYKITILKKDKELFISIMRRLTLKVRKR